MTVTTAEAQALSVQGPSTQMLPPAYEFMQRSGRKSLLPPYGTQERERALRRLFRHSQNTLIQGAFSGLVSKVLSTPFEINGPSESDAENAQDMLRLAHFGKGFEYLFSVTVLNFLRHDRGAYLELIGYGDPDGPMAGKPVAVAALDPLRCYPTGDRDYPILYWSTRGALHRMHHSRVVQIVDMPDGDDDYPDVGLCALSRAVSIADRQILANQYISSRLDDKPKPGLAVATNWNKEDRDAAFKEMRENRTRDEDADWGYTVWGFGTSPKEPITVEFVSFSEAPEKFDFVAYVQLDVNELALAIGVDKQELWELTGGGIGTGTQSQILAAKSRGKTFGRVLKSMERAFNFRTLPDECEFTWQYRDAQEDIERANIASVYMSVAAQLETIAGKRAALQMLANQVEAFRDVLLDEQGRVRLPDDDVDPMSPDATLDDSEERNSEPGDAMIQDDAPDDDESKEWGETASVATYQFVRMVNAARADQTSPRVLTTRLRAWLKQNGTQAYLDGMEEAGVEDPQLEATDRAAIQAWLSQQNEFASSFAAEVADKGMSDLVLAQRASAWVENSLGEVRLKGVASVKGNLLYRWKWNPSSEHCDTCKQLNGQVHRLKDYIRYNLRPKSPALECWIGCQCELEPAPAGSKVQGRLRAVPIVRRRKQYAQFMKVLKEGHSHDHPA